MATPRELTLILLSAWYCVQLKIDFSCRASSGLCGRFAFISIYSEYSCYDRYCDEARNKYQKRRWKVLR